MRRIHKGTRSLFVASATAFLFLILYMSPATDVFAASGTAISSFNPTTYTPGSGVRVSIAVTPESAVQAYAVEDAPPAGWTVSAIDNSGQFDSINNKVKWGPYFDNTPRTLGYTATPPAGTAGSHAFSGLASFDGTGVIISGARQINPTGPSYMARQWGMVGDKPVRGDFDGDGTMDIAVWRPSTGVWYYLLSGTPGSYSAVAWGMAGDIPVPADYNADGKTEIAVYRPSTGVWYMLMSISPFNYLAIQWGISTDVPIPADYNSDGKADIAVWRESSGVFYISFTE